MTDFTVQHVTLATIFIAAGKIETGVFRSRIEPDMCHSRIHGAPFQPCQQGRTQPFPSPLWNDGHVANLPGRIVEPMQSTGSDGSIPRIQTQRVYRVFFVLIPFAAPRLIPRCAEDLPAQFEHRSELPGRFRFDDAPGWVQDQEALGNSAGSVR